MKKERNKQNERMEIENPCVRMIILFTPNVSYSVPLLPLQPVGIEIDELTEMLHQ
jgi:hypothetical protein